MNESHIGDDYTDEDANPKPLVELNPEGVIKVTVHNSQKLLGV